MLVAASGCAHIPNVVCKSQILRILTSNLECLRVDVKEGSLILNNFLLFLHLVEPSHKIPIIAQHMVEGGQLKELSDCEKHKVGA